MNISLIVGLVVISQSTLIVTDNLNFENEKELCDWGCNDLKIYLNMCENLCHVLSHQSPTRFKDETECQSECASKYINCLRTCLIKVVT